MSLNMLPESLICPGGSPTDQIMYRKHSMTDKECSENNPSSTYSQEPCAFSELKNITLRLCGFAFIYAEIKSNSSLDGIGSNIHVVGVKCCWRLKCLIIFLLSQNLESYQTTEYFHVLLHKEMTPFHLLNVKLHWPSSPKLGPNVKSKCLVYEQLSIHRVNMLGLFAVQL